VERCSLFFVRDCVGLVPALCYGTGLAEESAMTEVGIAVIKAGNEGSSGNVDPEKDWRVGVVLPPLKEKGPVSLAVLSKQVVLENLVKVVESIVAQIDKGNMVALKLLIDLAALAEREESISERVMDSFALRLIEAAQLEREMLGPGVGEQEPV
jgi:hypothetical protein